MMKMRLAPAVAFFAVGLSTASAGASPPSLRTVTAIVADRPATLLLTERLRKLEESIARQEANLTRMQGQIVWALAAEAEEVHPVRREVIQQSRGIVEAAVNEASTQLVEMWANAKRLRSAVRERQKR